jgi:HK97 family phage portal protein
MRNPIMSMWSYFTSALSQIKGKLRTTPGSSLVPETTTLPLDSAMQISAVWACVDLRASLLASLPFFAYVEKDGRRVIDKSNRLYQLLHESPNSRMTPFEFWRCMILFHDLRGNAYARIDRDYLGEAIAMWPMPSDQVESKVLDDGSMVYEYRIGNDIAVFAEQNVLHIKNLGNGTVGLAKIDFMRATLDEAAKAQYEASRNFGSSGKPSGILMVDKVLNENQRKAVRKNFADMGEGPTSRLHLLEADMKYQQLSLSPADIQLHQSRQHGIEEICRWFNVPPVLIHHSNVTAWGSGVYEIIDGFYKFAIRTLCVSVEQAVRKRVFTPRQRVTMIAEYSLDALLRGSLKDRMEIYAKAVQNGLKTRNECRKLENDEPIDGGDELTVQSNLLPIRLLGKVKALFSGGSGDNIQQ